MVLRTEYRVLCMLDKHSATGPRLSLLTALKEVTSVTAMESIAKKLKKDPPSLPSTGHTAQIMRGELLCCLREEQAAITTTLLVTTPSWSASNQETGELGSNPYIILLFFFH